MQRSGAARRIFDGLSRTRRALRDRLQTLFGAGGGRDLDEILDGLEEALLLADVGPELSRELVESVRKGAASGTAAAGLLGFCRERLLTEMEAILAVPRGGNGGPAGPPAVHFFIGSHGVGKTTSVGRLACRHRRAGRRVLVAGSDTHRAAAGEQVGVWAERAGAELVTQKEGADAAAVVHDALRAAVSRGCDLVLVDTAGRMHSERNPMEDLRKMFRVAAKVLPGAPHENFLVVDAATGQNGLRQAEEFREVAAITGIVLTKLDGTAKGGIALSIGRRFHIPIRYVGVGEGPDDLIPFDPRGYLEAFLAGLSTGRETGVGAAAREGEA